MSKLFFIIGKTGSGKTTIMSKLFKIYNICHKPLKRLVMYTTRPMRPNEKDGEEYHFVDNDTFSTKLSNNELLEYREYDTAYGKWFYATPKFEDDDTNYIAQGTVEMYKKYTELLGDRVIPLLIIRDDIERVTGLISRELTAQGSMEADMREVYRRLYQDEVDFYGITDTIPHKFYNDGYILETSAEISWFIDCLLRGEEDGRRTLE